MKTYEYMFIQLTGSKTSPSDIVTEMNTAGKEGWRVLTINEKAGRTLDDQVYRRVTIYFERELETKT